jgi:hypothetical protein
MAFVSAAGAVVSAVAAGSLAGAFGLQPVVSNRQAASAKNPVLIVFFPIFLYFYLVFCPLIRTFAASKR